MRSVRLRVQASDGARAPSRLREKGGGPTLPVGRPSSSHTNPEQATDNLGGAALAGENEGARQGVLWQEAAEGRDQRQRQQAPLNNMQPAAGRGSSAEDNLSERRPAMYWHSHVHIYTGEAQ